MSDEKLMILRMMKDGKITEEEAMKLLDAIGENEKYKSKEPKDFDEIENNFVDKLTNSIDKVIRKTSEAISSIDFDDIATGFTTGFSKYRAKAERSFTMDIKDIENPSIDIANKNGKIQVFQWDNDFIELRGKILYDDKLISANNDFLKIEKKDDVIFIYPDYDNNGSKAFSAEIAVAVPRKKYKNFSAKSQNGSIEGSYIESENIVLESTNGKIYANNLRGNDIKLHSTNATIEAISTEGDDLEIRSSNGKIIVNGVYVQNTEVNTSNGRVEIQDISSLAKSINANTTNGSMKINVSNVMMPIKVSISKLNKYTNSANLSNRFTSILNDDSNLTAFTDGFKEEDERALRIIGSTTNGSINIDG